MTNCNGEDDVKAEVKKLFKPFRRELHWWMPGATMYGRTGTHDFIIVQRSLCWTIETKFGYNKPTAPQVRFAREIAQAGGMSLCINETNLWYVQMTLDYISAMHVLPHHYAHNFDALEKGKR
jgi:hypothetical protein